MKITVEEALRRVEDGAAMLRLLADSAAESVNSSDPHAFSGIADACGHLERLAREARRSLGVEALSTELKRAR
jgi:pyridoxal biosynthesis lyase PdxS